MKVLWKPKTIWKEWDAFCGPLLEGTRACDSGKVPPTDQSLPSGYSKEVDLYLRLSFVPPSDGIPPDIFADTPPVLYEAVSSRIAEAAGILRQILESRGDLALPTAPDPKQILWKFFQDLLLPSGAEKV